MEPFLLLTRVRRRQRKHGGEESCIEGKALPLWLHVRLTTYQLYLTNAA